MALLAGAPDGGPGQGRKAGRGIAGDGGPTPRSPKPQVLRQPPRSSMLLFDVTPSYEPPAVVGVSSPVADGNA